MHLIDFYDPPQNGYLGPYALYRDSQNRYISIFQYSIAVDCELWAHWTHYHPRILNCQALEDEYPEEMSELAADMSAEDLCATRMLSMDEYEYRECELMPCTWSQFREDPDTWLSLMLL